ncbi:hypothetical protein BHE74_00041135 [Ensete ventricosum]|nr:hypothetical protein BHE74_00041135 [Ensete ventricosum]
MMQKLSKGSALLKGRRGPRDFDLTSRDNEFCCCPHVANPLSLSLSLSLFKKH